MRPTLLIDGNNLFIRAVEATRHTAMSSPTGVDTRALVVFANTLARYIREVKPYEALVLWDGDSEQAENWRKKIYPQYKANRPQPTDEHRRYRSHSRALVTQFLKLARVPQFTVHGQEADDLFGAYWRTLDTDIVILSNDKDLSQLVGPTPKGGTCRQIRVSSSDTPTDHWHAERVEEHYGCTPEQLPLVLALWGDSSDNIPGVPGIGVKFAVKHLSAAGWDLDAITHLGIVEHRADVAVYLDLVDLRTPRPALDADLPDPAPFMPTTLGPDQAWRDLYAFLAEHALNQILTRLTANELW